jgi:hypothetical protein
MDDKAWLTKFVVTPHIQHAIDVLRAAIPLRGDIPNGGEGIVIERKLSVLTAMSSRVELAEIDPDEEQSYEEMTLTEEQAAAAELLLATLAYHAFLIKQAYALPDDEEIRAYSYGAVSGGPVPDGRLKAQDDLLNDLERTFKLSTDVLSGEDSLRILS